MSTLKTHIESEVFVDYDYEPPCRETNHHAAIIINVVSIYGIDLLPALSRSEIDRLEELCFADMVDSNEPSY